MELVDITPSIADLVTKSKVNDGLCVIFVPHTTAAITVNENCDPSVKSDISNTLKELAPEGSAYEHSEGNADAHVKSSIVGSSKTIFVDEGKLVFGRWQGIFLCEFDGPRNREVWVKIIEEWKK